MWASRERGGMSQQRGSSRWAWIPWRDRLRRLPRQVLGRSPFAGDLAPARVPLLARGRPTLPFPHPWNCRRPLDILDTFFTGADEVRGPGRHNRYLDVPGFAPVLVTRDPALIRAIAAETGDKPGQFDRDPMPSRGIARATGPNTLLYANGERWRAQKKLSVPPFARTTLYQPERFEAFEATFRRTALARIEVLKRLIDRPGGTARVKLEPEIKGVILEMLVNNFFGAEIPADKVRTHYAPAIDRVIAHIVRDTVVNKVGCPLHAIPRMTRRIGELKDAQAAFDELTELVLAPRRAGRGLWSEFRSDAPDAALRDNIRAFLAGALEASTSYAGWAIAHLARNPDAQEKVYSEVRDAVDYTPEGLAKATYLAAVLDETLRLTPALYFFPRLPTVDTWVETTGGKRLFIPRGTHILLAVWHANRHEDHWGVGVTGFPASAFVPERWLGLDGRGTKDLLHFGFGHGPRFCPGKSLGQVEVALVVAAVVKMFRFTAPNAANVARAGVSTKPEDGVLVDLTLR